MIDLGAWILDPRFLTGPSSFEIVLFFWEASATRPKPIYSIKFHDEINLQA